MTFFNLDPMNVNSLECVSMINREYKIRPEIINLNTNERQETIKNINVQLFNLINENKTHKMA